MNNNLSLEEQIYHLKKTNNAIILGHYYIEDELQDIADFVGDSLDLSRKAASTDADIIVFCGVTFMAEVAKILNPNKKVLVPDINAGCSLEESCKADDFSKFCAKYPDHIVVSYINCSAEIKALSDIIVTSSNAEKIIRQIPQNKEIIFAPDKHLGSYLQKITGREMLLWQGSCMVHEQFSYKSLIKLKTRYPHAQTIAHPECPEELLHEADFIGSTSKLLNFVTEKAKNDFIILTEPGIIHQMKKIAPQHNYLQVPGIDKENAECEYCNNCPHMKLNNLEKLHNALKYQNPEIILNNNLAKKAKKSLDLMLKLS